MDEVASMYEVAKFDVRFLRDFYAQHCGRLATSRCTSVGKIGNAQGGPKNWTVFNSL